MNCEKCLVDFGVNGKSFEIRLCPLHESSADLLEALTAYIKMHDENRHEMPEINENEGKRWTRIRKMANAAIAKAKGK